MAPAARAPRSRTGSNVSSLSDAVDKKVEQLSKGNQQKVQIAAALLAAPAVVILDEPLSGLDPVSARLVNRAIRDYAAAGHTVLLSTHQMNLVESLCTRVFMIAHGRRVLYGDLKTIKREHSHSNGIRVLSDADYRSCPLVERVIAAGRSRKSRRIFSSATTATADQFLGWLVANKARVQSLRAIDHAARGHLRQSRPSGRSRRMNKAFVVAKWEFIATVTRVPYIVAVVALAALVRRPVHDCRPLQPECRRLLRAHAGGGGRPGARRRSPASRPSEAPNAIAPAPMAGQEVMTMAARRSPAAAAVISELTATPLPLVLDRRR